MTIRACIVVAAVTALSPLVHADSGTIAPYSLPRGVSASSYFGQHNQRVEAAMLRFVTSLPVEEQANRLDFFRERDRLRLWHPPGMQEPPSAAIGSSLFAAAVILAAHAPGALRLVVDTPWLHLGPSVCDTGGVGIALGGRF